MDTFLTLLLHIDILCVGIEASCRSVGGQFVDGEDATNPTYLKGLPRST